MPGPARSARLSTVIHASRVQYNTTSSWFTRWRERRAPLAAFAIFCGKAGSMNNHSFFHHHGRTAVLCAGALFTATALAQNETPPIPAVVRLPPGVTPPRTISQSEPEYSEEARRALVNATL